MATVLSSLSRSRRVRYAAPALVAVVALGAGPFVNAVTADAHGSLPPRTAAQLLVDVAKAQVTGISGTVVETSDLGLPALPSIGGAGGNDADFSSLISGSHTMRVWSAGPDRVRISLLGRLGESDLVRHGSDVWAWSSHTNTATHWIAPVAPGPAVAAMTPQQVATTVLKAVGPTTRVSTDPTAEVAGRPAYELDLVPRDTRSLVGSVRIAIDGSAHVPTRVQVFARGASHPAFQIGFTSFSTATPADSVFRFTPPPGATVKEALQAGGANGSDLQGKPDSPPQVVGKGWTSVVVAHLPADAIAGLQSGSDGPSGALLKSLPTVSGSWGSGRVLRSALFSVVLTDDGRVAIGAVPPSVLYGALSRA